MGHRKHGHAHPRAWRLTKDAELLWYAAEVKLRAERRTFAFMLMKVAACERIVQHAEQLPWSKSYTSRLRKVGLSMARFVSHGKQLPTDSQTLYHLARLTDARYGELIANGTINPSMKRNEASAETWKERKR